MRQWVILTITKILPVFFPLLIWYRVAERGLRERERVGERERGGRHLPVTARQVPWTLPWTWRQRAARSYLPCLRAVYCRMLLFLFLLFVRFIIAVYLLGFLMLFAFACEVVWADKHDTLTQLAAFCVKSIYSHACGCASLPLRALQFGMWSGEGSAAWLNSWAYTVIYILLWSRFEVER